MGFDLIFQQKVNNLSNRPLHLQSFPAIVFPSHISRFQHAITKNSESLLKLKVDKIMIKKFHVGQVKSS